MIAIHDPPLLDTLERLEAAWQGTVWRQVIGDTDPLRANSRGARWNPPDTEALYSVPQRIGAAAAWLGIAVLIVPSARHGEGNVVVFVNELQPEDLVELVSED